MKETRIQLKRGYAETYVTILCGTTLQIETIEKIKSEFESGKNFGDFVQQPNSKSSMTFAVKWYMHEFRKGRALDYYGWTLKPSWSNDNHNAFERLKEIYPESTFGSTNVAPVNFREITSQEFAKGSNFNYVIATNYYQIRKLNDGTPTHRIPLFVKMSLRSDGTGFGMETYKGEVLYYAFELCKHDFELKNVGNCLTQYSCKNCKYSTTVDSSG